MSGVRPSGTSKRTFVGLDELVAEVGRDLPHSDWLEVDQERVDRFAEATGDFQWIHLDVERAADGPFGGTIAHGYLTLSLVSALVAEIYEVQGLSMGINYGCNKVRFPAPLPVGSRMRAGARITAVEPFGAGFQVFTTVTMEREGGDKPVCVAEIISYLVP